MDHFKAILKPWTLPADSAISVPRGEQKNFILAEMWSPIEISALFKRVTIGGWIVNDKVYGKRIFLPDIVSVTWLWLDCAISPETLAVTPNDSQASVVGVPHSHSSALVGLFWA